MPAASVAVVVTRPESTRTTVFTPVAVDAAGAVPWGTTPANDVPVWATESVNGLVASNAPFLPLTRT